MSVDLVVARAAIGDALGTIAGLRVFPYVPDSVSPPAAIVEWDTIEYDNTMGRGTDRVTFNVTVVVGKAHDRAASIAVDTYAEGTAAVKAALDAVGPHVRVERVRKTTIVIAAQEFASATFEVDYVA